MAFPGPGSRHSPTLRGCRPSHHRRPVWRMLTERGWSPGCCSNLGCSTDLARGAAECLWAASESGWAKPGQVAKAPVTGWPSRWGAAALPSRWGAALPSPSPSPKGRRQRGTGMETGWPCPRACCRLYPRPRLLARPWLTQSSKGRRAGLSDAGRQPAEMWVMAVRSHSRHRRFAGPGWRQGSPQTWLHQQRYRSGFGPHQPTPSWRQTPRGWRQQRGAQPSAVAAARAASRPAATRRGAGGGVRQ